MDALSGRTRCSGGAQTAVTGSIHDRARRGLGAQRTRRPELVLAADQFLIRPVGRVQDHGARQSFAGTRGGPSSPATTGSPTGAATR